MIHSHNSSSRAVYSCGSLVHELAEPLLGLFASSPLTISGTTAVLRSMLQQGAKENTMLGCRCAGLRLASTCHALHLVTMHTQPTPLPHPLQVGVQRQGQAWGPYPQMQPAPDRTRLRQGLVVAAHMVHV